MIASHPENDLGRQLKTFIEEALSRGN
jgi:hypothetical protein